MLRDLIGNLEYVVVVRHLSGLYVTHDGGLCVDSNGAWRYTTEDEWAMASEIIQKAREYTGLSEAFMLSQFRVELCSVRLVD